MHTPIKIVNEIYIKIGRIEYRCTSLESGIIKYKKI